MRKSFIVPVAVLAMVAFGGSAVPAQAGKNPPVAVLKQQGSWNATEQFPLVGTGAANPKWDSTSRATVKYKFTAVNGTAWRIDDLFIDPKRH